jgi:hypothetical protein
MSYHANTLISKVDRIGNSDATDRVRQSKANILLEGLTPNSKTAKVIQGLVTNAITPAAAISEIRSWYVRRT